MRKILIIEDDESFIDFLIELASDYSDYFETIILNPKVISFDNILRNISSNSYSCILLDHNYIGVNYTGKKIAQKCNFTGDIYSISSDKHDIEYCTKYLGKANLQEFFENCYDRLASIA